MVKREGSTFYRQWPFSKGGSKKEKSIHDNEYGHGQEKRRPPTLSGKDSEEANLSRNPSTHQITEMINLVYKN